MSDLETITEIVILIIVPLLIELRRRMQKLEEAVKISNGKALEVVVRASALEEAVECSACTRAPQCAFAAALPHFCGEFRPADIKVIKLPRRDKNEQTKDLTPERV